MRVLAVIVGARSEHWEGFFDALTAQPDLELTLVAADVSETATARLRALERDRPSFRFRAAPHTLGERLTGHMASVVLRPGWRRGLRAWRPDVVHVMGEPAYLSTAQAIRARNRLWPDALVTLTAAQNVVTRFPLPFPWLERYAYANAALAFPLTPAALNVLRTKGYGGPAAVVPLGVDLGRFRPRGGTPNLPFTVGFVGRLEPHKGLADLVEACDRLSCCLLVVGDGSLRPWLSEVASKRPGRVQLASWATHDELPGLLARMHVLALPSIEVVQRNVLPWVGVPLREQFGRVLVEAMACGVPVVGTRVGEVPHVIGPAGLTALAGDPAALAAALTRVRDDAALAGTLACAGLERARLFSWTRIADEVRARWTALVDDQAALPRPA
jgi:glycosyltransferase involved in cell wall biosynthesis